MSVLGCARKAAQLQLSVLDLKTCLPALTEFFGEDNKKSYKCIHLYFFSEPSKY